MGFLEPGRVHLHSVCWDPPQPWSAHITCQICEPGPRVQEMGNTRARQLYEANLPESFRRPQTDQYP
ncbi:hypothetical protein Z043_104903, partial [Scleropages formosus]